ncbi:DUF1826 domain-containing protein [Acinetobacter larvae]|uniref:DUF1826 domain-containing protein n=1 Tax=Acinetobacter larvae TaxID=1789224 RepID=A0A1B2LZN1_9GAMM|nr:DUF1826 domain-containing protein [Acinetobacter larvae]AOA58395.1 DUF1826 domain-containing protein [Acinetobacter larvae]
MQRTWSEHTQIRVVNNFSDLVQLHFQGKMNAICWSRTLMGDFQEIVEKLLFKEKEDITEVSIADLRALKLSAQGDLAREIIIQDIQLLTDFGASPVLNLLKQYERDDSLDFITTDVYSYHVDRSPIETDTFLCTYYGPASDILPNDQVEQKILIPEIRQKLKKLYSGPESEFDAFLEEYFFDLHYQAKANAKAVNLGCGHLWRLAVDHPTQQAEPCVHRAPAEDGVYRLLLIC